VVLASPSDEALSVDTTRFEGAPKQPRLLSLMCSYFPRSPVHIARAEPDDKGNSMTIGIVKFFNTSKGFGFISPEGGGKDVFVHATAVEAAGLRSLSEGQRVSFDIQPDARGAKATNLKVV
jgi:CspA family cold shock protein